MCELAAFNASHEMPLLNTLHKSMLIVLIEMHIEVTSTHATTKKAFYGVNAVVALKYNQSNQFSLTKECATESAHK